MQSTDLVAARAAVAAIYSGSNGDDTKALYAKMSAKGPAGTVAINLFRA
jgi:hypothetical protein